MLQQMLQQQLLQQQQQKQQQLMQQQQQQQQQQHIAFISRQWLSLSAAVVVAVSALFVSFGTNTYINPMDR